VSNHKLGESLFLPSIRGASCDEWNKSIMNGFPLKSISLHRKEPLDLRDENGFIFSLSLRSCLCGRGLWSSKYQSKFSNAFLSINNILETYHFKHSDHSFGGLSYPIPNGWFGGMKFHQCVGAQAKRQAQSLGKVGANPFFYMSMGLGMRLMIFRSILLKKDEAAMLVGWDQQEVRS
jgi:hypothetical protein